MLYPGGVAFGAYFKFAGLLSFGNLGVKRRPFGARLAALKTETDLLARAAAVARLGVDRHAAGVNLLITDLGCAGGQDLEVVVARQPWDAVGASDAHFVLGLGVVGLEILEWDRPIHVVRVLDGSVDGAGLELVLLETERRAGPVHS